MNTEHINNAAGRLHRLLREIRGYNEQVNNPAPQVWAKILDVPDGDLPALLRRMALVVGLPDQAEREVKQMPDLDHQHYLVWRPKADSILANVNFQGKFGGIAGQIDDPTLSLLLICDDLIVKNAPALSIDVETLDGLLTEVRNLIDEVERSEGTASTQGFHSSASAHNRAVDCGLPIAGYRSVIRWTRDNDRHREGKPGTVR